MICTLCASIYILIWIFFNKQKTILPAHVGWFLPGKPNTSHGWEMYFPIETSRPFHQLRQLVVKVLVAPTAVKARSYRRQPVWRCVMMWCLHGCHNCIGEGVLIQWTKKPNKRGISRKVTYITSWYEWKGARLSSSGVSKIPVLVARDVELPTPTIPWSGKDKDGNGWQVMFRTWNVTKNIHTLFKYGLYIPQGTSSLYPTGQEKERFHLQKGWVECGLFRRRVVFQNSSKYLVVCYKKKAFFCTWLFLRMQVASLKAEWRSMDKNPVLFLSCWGR